MYQKHLNEKTLLNILNKEKAAAGDVFFLPAGRIHAIGAGILLAEIQQTSDATLRIYDFDRLDDAGKPRELHTEKALEAIDFSPVQNFRTSYGLKPNVSNKLVACDYFVTNLIELKSAVEKDYSGLDSFVIFMCLEGSFDITYYDHEKENVVKGDTILLPADIKKVQLIPKQGAKLLEVYIPLFHSDNTDDLFDRLL
jgi:mannose-6-phosphate isomerase